MKYYIDFEASEAQHMIISVGCIREDGKEFYSLCYTDDPITPRIEGLTGITQEDINNAPEPAEVFSDLYDWCNNDGEIPEFMCYGNGDYDFVYNSYNNATTLKEASMLSFLYLNMYDCSEDIKEHFYVNKTISLEKLGKHFDSENFEQNHNALDDAKLLMKVYEKVLTGENEFRVFDEYLDPNRYPDQVRKVMRINNGEVIQEFNNIEEACKWLNSQPNDKGPGYLNNAKDKIKKAAREGGKYFGCNWRII